MKRILILSAMAALFLAGCTQNDSDPNTAISTQETASSSSAPTTNTDTEVIADNLDVPWSIEKQGETFYLTERGGNVIKIEDGETQQQPVAFEETLSSASEAGFLGFVLRPDFATSNVAYGYYTYEGADGRMNRIVQLQLDGNQWRETEVLLDEIPSGNNHHGGRMKIGPDDKLYVTTGDASEPDNAQDMGSLAGKILRLNLDGSIPGDNPFTDSYIYTYGHRNSQGLTWSTDDTMYASEHGASADDEINVIEAGKNYGWPVIEGNETQDGMEAPLFSSGNQTWAPSGMGYHDQKLYVAALRGEAVLEFDLENNQTSELISDFGRIRDVYIDGDDLYFITNNRDGRGSPSDNDDQLVKVSLQE
ncbi:PQQ-dependent sugar dehydrogenase [Enterococcus sp. 669A]|uniref:PQQ-dependent sugar dehydrogenase n=1 Tax=Candidatus Enterococcus moelleringii TaxID=2815325 RepID=A0ABS3L6M7_9ENTE|nr:PQQ-dependent sugar dehydrogenase [Enterococcus sp. 669A]MBO1305277.1 PQQ-dependent sugar dehydrogenase [Enterococcus sp. 669A]